MSVYLVCLIVDAPKGWDTRRIVQVPASSPDEAITLALELARGEIASPVMRVECVRETGYEVPRP